jgi:hypothetical protein
MFSCYFNILILQIIFLKKYYFNIFLNKKIFYKTITLSIQIQTQTRLGETLTIPAELPSAPTRKKEYS